MKSFHKDEKRYKTKVRKILSKAYDQQRVEEMEMLCEGFFISLDMDSIKDEEKDVETSSPFEDCLDDSASLFDPTKPPIFDEELEGVFNPSKPPIFDEEDAPLTHCFLWPQSKKHDAEVFHEGAITSHMKLIENAPMFLEFLALKLKQILGFR